MTVRSVGVEEELLLIQPGTGKPMAVAETALRTDPRDDVEETLEFELQRQQLETNTKPCRDLDELSAELHRCRLLAADVAARVGAQVAALATVPLHVEPELVRTDRYVRMAEAYGLTAHQQLTCGCHVHVDIASADEGVAVLDRIGPWLPVLLALSANSPYWQGQDTEYASYRYQAWSRWPSAGPTQTFGTAEAYKQTVRQMVDTGAIVDSGMVYFDARLSDHYPTVELRVADVCLRADDAVLIAALARALVETEARRWQAGDDEPSHRTEMLRLASWRASRSGLDGVLVHPASGLPEPAGAVTDALFAHVRDALDDAGDTATVRALLDAVRSRGNGATFQRDPAHGGDLSVLINAAVAVTAH